MKILDREADEAAKYQKQKRRGTVIVLDNYSVHTSVLIKAKRKEWEQKELYLFFLPTSGPELNLIAAEWHQIKTYQIARRMFEDEYDLAKAIKQSLCQRSSAKKYQLKQYKLNSNYLKIERQNDISF